MEGRALPPTFKPFTCSRWYLVRPAQETGRANSEVTWQAGLITATTTVNKSKNDIYSCN